MRSGVAQRVERYEQASGTLAATVRSFGYRAAVAAPVSVGGRLWGVLAAATTSDDALPEGLERRLCDFAELVAQALANADAYEKLAASRARLVEVGDAERRRLERNLHDGAQQRFVSVALELNIAAAKLEHDPGAAREALSAAQDELAQRSCRAARAGPRHPPRRPHRARSRTRAERPARAGTRSRSRSRSCPNERLSATVEAAAYYVVAESIANVGKYARASRATVSISRSNGRATVTVSDDGVGGADPSRGSGLRGLAARVEALNGSLGVDSPAGHGTRIEAEIPIPE